jgi:nucleotide-binding universal stress UspA family protein
MTVVVAYDGSAPARRALAEAVRQAADDERIVVVHAYEPPHDWLGSPDYQRVLDTHRGRGEALLAELEGAPELGGRKVETDLLAGSAAEAVIAAAQAHDAREIVVGSRGYGPLRAALGSVSLRVLHLTDRPVLVVPAPHD